MGESRGKAGNTSRQVCRGDRSRSLVINIMWGRLGHDPFLTKVRRKILPARLIRISWHSNRVTIIRGARRNISQLLGMTRAALDSVAIIVTCTGVSVVARALWGRLVRLSILVVNRRVRDRIREVRYHGMEWCDLFLFLCVGALEPWMMTM